MEVIDAARRSAPDYRTRARLSAGRSAGPIHEMVERGIRERGLRELVVVDVGCGTGDLLTGVADLCRRYIGVDAVRYDGFPAGGEFVAMDLNAAESLPAFRADVVVAVETIEHLENPRAFMRLLTRLVRPGGWVFVTTPNQRSLLSLATLVVRGQFSQFQDVHYPAHLTALLEVDLRRIAEEVGLEEISVSYSGAGRMVFSAAHYPRALSRLFPVALSDNLMVAGRQPR
jgi:2-polyprenyl-3-methyl-5-hydroxy-6-metoxy-1,4-benzoquinol methylase